MSGQAGSISRYTFFVEIRGGTYISQVQSTGVREALSSWLAGSWLSEIGDIKTRELPQLIHDLEADYPTAIRGVESVWCASALVGKDVLLLHIVG